jgi:UDP-N-acetylglucosamine 2-epimerase (non-hydrolysing)
LKALHVAGARPNFMKIAPLVRAFEARGAAAPVCHTGQHYDERMSRLFFDELAIPRPVVNLEVGSGSHAAQTAAVMERFEPVVQRERPDLVVVVGDVNSTMAAALVCAKLRVPLAHVEAGLRSFDRSMPEEVNRVVTDSVSDLLYCTEEAGVVNLANEGVTGDRVQLVGNVMIDTLLAHEQRARASGARARYAPGAEYGLVTLHRPSNVDAAGTAGGLARALADVSQRLPLVFPMHPRTRAAFDAAGLLPLLTAGGRIRIIEPLGYLEFLDLMSGARLVLTDSGGIQEETTVLGVPCLTLRANTERPATVEHGTNRVVGTDPAAVLRAAEESLASPPRGRRPGLWDGKAAERVADHALAWTRQDEVT